jgi:hypothetical protein
MSSTVVLSAAVDRNEELVAVDPCVLGITHGDRERVQGLDEPLRWRRSSAIGETWTPASVTHADATLDAAPLGASKSP